MNIRLPQDDPFDLLLHPDGTWDLMVLDVLQAQIPYHYDLLTDANNRLVSEFIDKIKVLKVRLQ